jgi:UDP-GlcNAc:undecaprenyl-phosphate/decaprenyl-phosphate GlcNAc-1-phosphate transferase
MTLGYFLRLVFFFVCAYSLSFFLTPLAITVSRGFGVFARPGGRRHHAVPIPTGVGVAPALTMAVMTMVYLLLPEAAQQASVFTPEWGRLYLVGLAIVLLTGAVDDKWDISPWVKLMAELLLATFVYSQGVTFGSQFLGFSISPSVDFCCTVGWLIVVMNAYNLIDGYDGLACGLAAISGLGLFGILILRGQFHEAMIVSALIGAVLGFGRYNWAPARAFLGDTGSLFIGFSFAFFSLSSSLKGASFISFWLPVLCFGVPLFDTLLAVWRRIARKVILHLQQSPFSSAVTGGDAEHLHHRLVATGLTPTRMNWVLYLANSLLVFAAVISISVNNSALLTAGMIVLLLVAVVVVKCIARIELRESSKVVVLACSTEANPVLARLGYAAIDVLAVILLYFFSHSLARMETGEAVFSAVSLEFLWGWVLLFIPSNILLDRYWVEWRKALSVRRAFVRACMHAVLALFCCALEKVFLGGSTLELLLQATLFCCSFSIWSTLIRMLPAHLESALLAEHLKQEHPDKP